MPPTTGPRSSTRSTTPCRPPRCSATAAWRTTRRYGVVVHPPLGKQLIAIGEKLFGYTPLGWRFASVIAGTMVIFLMIRVVRRLTRSTLDRRHRRGPDHLRRRQLRDGQDGAARRLPGSVHPGRLRLSDRRSGTDQGAPGRVRSSTTSSRPNAPESWPSGADGATRPGSRSAPDGGGSAAASSWV